MPPFAHKAVSTYGNPNTEIDSGTRRVDSLSWLDAIACVVMAEAKNKTMRRIILLTTLVLAFVATAVAAGPVPVPEVDAGGLGKAVAVLAGGYLVIAARLRRKK